MIRFDAEMMYIMPLTGRTGGRPLLHRSWRLLNYSDCSRKRELGHGQEGMWLLYNNNVRLLHFEIFIVCGFVVGVSRSGHHWAAGYLKLQLVHILVQGDGASSSKLQ